VLVERDIDCGELYGAQRRELVALARSLTEDQLRTTVPATPEWSVHDVVAHVVGIAADLNAGRFGSEDPDVWTRRQVETRRDHSVDELAGEWEREAPTFEEGLRLLGYEIGSHYVGDLLHHIVDVRSALGLQRIPDDLTLVVALDFYLDSLHQTLCAAAIGSLEVRTPNESWVLGEGEVVASMAASRFEVFRCLGGRRSGAQIRQLEWSGAVDTVLPHLSRYPLPNRDLIDP